MKAIDLHSIIVVCDDCDFEVEAEPKEYLNKSCPKCGAKNLITENDIITHNIMVNLSNIMNETMGEVPDSTSTKTMSMEITNGIVQSMEIKDE